MGINWKVRIKNPMFWLGLIGAIGAPILAYLGMSASDLTTWETVGNVATYTLTNPYLIVLVILSALSFVGVITDPTTKGITDSARALTYTEPKGDDDADVS